jgi:predicted nucleotidyltransferase
MREVTDLLLKQIVDAIVRAVDPEEIILFGSRASGSARPQSDIDLLIVDSEPFDDDRRRFKTMADLWHILGSFAVPVDILLYSRSEVEGWRDSVNHVIARALREGKVLYARP